MALSQDEQRILAEIERRLAGDDPGLASSLTAFRRPPGKMVRSPRARGVSPCVPFDRTAADAEVMLLL